MTYLPTSQKMILYEDANIGFTDFHVWSIFHILSTYEEKKANKKTSRKKSNVAQSV